MTDVEAARYLDAQDRALNGETTHDRAIGEQDLEMLEDGMTPGEIDELTEEVGYVGPMNTEPYDPDTGGYGHVDGPHQDPDTGVVYGTLELVGDLPPDDDPETGDDSWDPGDWDPTPAERDRGDPELSPAIGYATEGDTGHVLSMEPDEDTGLPSREPAMPEGFPPEAGTGDDWLFEARADRDPE